MFSCGGGVLGLCLGTMLTMGDPIFSDDILFLCVLFGSLLGSFWEDPTGLGTGGCCIYYVHGVMRFCRLIALREHAMNAIEQKSSFCVPAHFFLLAE